VIYAGVDDTRACSACVCGAAENVVCDGDIEVRVGYTNEAGIQTTDPVETYVADGDCTGILTANSLPMGPALFLVQYPGGPPVPSATGCTPTGGEPTGDAVGTEPITLCCTLPED
jgi:hypothetical protein